jgi:hypothetical protein
LKATGFDFSAIPLNATINGVLVRMNCWYASGTGAASVDLYQLLDNTGAKVGTNKCSTPVALTTATSRILSIGGSSDLWGNALTPAWVRDADFGVAIGMIATADDSDVHVDWVAITVSFTRVAVDASPGSYAVAGTAASLLKSSSFEPVAGSYAIAGQEATLTKSLAVITLACDPGAFEVSGQDANLLSSRVIVPEEGSLDVTGPLAALLYHRALQPEVGDYAIGGQSCSLLYGRNLTAELGEYSIAGQVAALLATRKLNCEIGSYSLTGNDVDLGKWILDVPGQIILLSDGALAKKISSSFYLKL